MSRRVEAGLQARADGTVTVKHSKMPSNALQRMHGQKVPILSPQPSWLQV